MPKKDQARGTSPNPFPNELMQEDSKSCLNQGEELGEPSQKEKPCVALKLCNGQFFAIFPVLAITQYKTSPYSCNLVYHSINFIFSKGS